MVKTLPVLLLLCVLGALFFWKSAPNTSVSRTVANDTAKTSSPPVVAEQIKSTDQLQAAAQPIEQAKTENTNVAEASVVQTTKVVVKAKVSTTKEDRTSEEAPTLTPTPPGPLEPSPVPSPAAPLPVPPPTVASQSDKKIWLQLGVGSAYQNLRNTQDSIESKFQSFEVPALSVSTGFEVNTFGLDLSFDSQPGKVSSSDSTSVVGGSYKWQTIKATGTFRANPESKWKIHIGVQQDTSPLIYPDSTTMQAFVRSVQLTDIALGAEFLPEFSNGSRFFAKAYYLLPVGGSTLDRADFKIRPTFHAAASAGAQFLISEQTYLGFQGKVQTQDYKFTYRDNPNAPEIEGKQSLMSTSFELQLGWNF